MNRWNLIDTATVPGSPAVMTLMHREDEMAIWVDDRELMSSRQHGSEDALAELAFKRHERRGPLRVLVGGLGMGFTLAAALRCARSDDTVTVAELVPAVLAWHRDMLGSVAGYPLQDPRVVVFEGDVAVAIRSGPWDLVLLDVDNGPNGLTAPGNDWLYGWDGLHAIRTAIGSRGVLGVWSATQDPAFTRRLSRAGFEAKEHGVRSRGAKGGHRHTVWIATVRPGAR